MQLLIEKLCTVFPRIVAAATIYFVVRFSAAINRGRLLFEGGYCFAKRVR